MSACEQNLVEVSWKGAGTSLPPQKGLSAVPSQARPAHLTSFVLLCRHHNQPPYTVFFAIIYCPDRVQTSSTVYAPQPVSTRNVSLLDTTCISACLCAWLLGTAEIAATASRLDLMQQRIDMYCTIEQGCEDTQLG